MKQKYNLIYAILIIYMIFAILSFVACAPPRGELTVTSPEIADESPAPTQDAIVNEEYSITQTIDHQEDTQGITQSTPAASSTPTTAPTEKPQPDSQDAAELTSEIDTALDEVEELLNEIDEILALDLN